MHTCIKCATTFKPPAYFTGGQGPMCANCSGLFEATQQDNEFKNGRLEMVDPKDEAEAQTKDPNKVEDPIPDIRPDLTVDSKYWGFINLMEGDSISGLMKQTAQIAQEKGWWQDGPSATISLSCTVSCPRRWKLTETRRRLEAFTVILKESFWASQSSWPTSSSVSFISARNTRSILRRRST